MHAHVYVLFYDKEGREGGGEYINEDAYFIPERC